MALSGTAEAAWMALGRQLAESRRAARLSQQALAPLAGYSRSTVANAETGRQRVPRDFWERCDGALGTGTALARGYDEVAALERHGHQSAAVQARHARVSADSLMEPVVSARMPAGDVAPASGDRVESIRLRLASAVAGRSGGSGAEAWEQAVLQHGEATRLRPPGELVLALSADMAELEGAIGRCRSVSSLRRLVRVAAQLSGLMCLMFVRLDEQAAFGRWAQTARMAAVEAEDAVTAAWVLAQEAHGHFFAGDLPAAVATARRAQGATPRSPCVGAALAAALEARALAAMGDARGTRAALGRAETVMGRLDAGWLTASAFGYSESQFRFHEADAYTLLRDTRAALMAQERALRLCPPADYTDWALIRLDRAMCLARGGEADAAVAYAAETVAEVGGERSQGIIVRRGLDVLEAVPASYRAQPASVELADLLRAGAGTPKEKPCP